MVLEFCVSFEQRLDYVHVRFSRGLSLSLEDKVRLTLCWLLSFDVILHLHSSFRDVISEGSGDRSSRLFHWLVAWEEENSIPLARRKPQISLVYSTAYLLHLASNWLMAQDCSVLYSKVHRISHPSGQMKERCYSSAENRCGSAGNIASRRMTQTDRYWWRPLGQQSSNHQCWSHLTGRPC